MNSRKTQFGAVLGILACALLAGAWQRAPVGATAIIRYTPPTNLPDTDRKGYCWTSSIAASRADAWRCMEPYSIHDPCFTMADQKAVVCDANPAKGKVGFKLNLTKPLPEPDVHPTPSGQHWPWLIQLNDGTTCTQATGTSPLLRGQAAHYGCTSKVHGQLILLVGDLDTSKPLWAAKRAALFKSGSEWRAKESKSVVIKAVWE